MLEQMLGGFILLGIAQILHTLRNLMPKERQSEREASGVRQAVA